jgi:hypothetical protein
MITGDSEVHGSNMKAHILEYDKERLGGWTNRNLTSREQNGMYYICFKKEESS